MDSPENTTPAALADSSSINECFRQLHEQQDEWGRFLNRSLDELEQCFEELAQREQEIDRQRMELEQQRETLQATREQLETETVPLEEHTRQISELEGELRGLREELDAQCEADIGHTAANDVALEREIEQLTVERKTIDNELSEAQTRIAQLERSLEALAHSAGHITSVEDADSGAISEENAQLTEQIERMLGEREELEQELEDVRSNTSQLSDALEKSKRQIAEERAEWSVELKQMRVILQRQSDMFQTYASNPNMPASTIVPNLDAPTGESEDESQTGNQIVGSVMAQFEKIRQQRSKRNGQKSQGPKKNDCA